MLTKKYNLALPLYEEVLQRRKSKLGHDHPEALQTMNDFGLACLEAKQIDRALPLLEEALKLRRRRLAPDDARIPTSINNLALAYQAAGKDAEAIPLFEEALATNKARRGPDHSSTLIMMNNLAASYREVGRLDRAVPLLEEAVAGLEKLRFQDTYADRIVHHLCNVYEQVQKNYAGAESWRRKWLVVLEERHGALSVEHAQEQAQLGWNLVQQGKWTEAETMLRQALTVRQEKQPDEWRTFNTCSVLGDAILGQKKYADAEPLLLQGYEGMKLREAQIPPNGKQWLTQSLERLVRLYQAWNKPTEAAKWQKKLEAEKERLKK
jgi:tetratricopeptide (TPR) repeat protein